MDTGKDILKTMDLEIGYRNKGKDLSLANNLNLTLRKGELVCLMGKNGIGKSTLLRTITGVQPKLSGNIQLKGVELKKINPIQIAQSIAVVLTERIAPSNLTVLELVALSRAPYTNWLGILGKDDQEAVEFALQETDLLNLKHKKVDELSDGQFQRVMICRALAQNTELIILDEPTAHLDIQHKIETFRLLHKFAHHLNKAILVSTHEIQLGLQSSDELWLMHTGGISTGKPEQLIKNKEINLLFDNPKIHFDEDKMQFILKKESYDH